MVAIAAVVVAGFVAIPFVVTKLGRPSVED